MFESPKSAFAATLLLAACAPMGATWSPEESPKSLATYIAAESFVVKLDAERGVLPAGEREELRRYLLRLGELATVEFSLRRTHDNLSSDALRLVEKELIALGADPKRIQRLAEIGVEYEGHWADVEIIAKRYVVRAPSCPDWSRPDTLDYQNLGASNLGCATASSLALQVADPRDLVRGRELGHASGAREVGAIKRYETDNVKTLRKQPTKEEN